MQIDLHVSYSIQSAINLASVRSFQLLITHRVAKTFAGVLTGEYSAVCVESTSEKEFLQGLYDGQNRHE